MSPVIKPMVQGTMIKRDHQPSKKMSILKIPRALPPRMTPRAIKTSPQRTLDNYFIELLCYGFIITGFLMDMVEWEYYGEYIYENYQGRDPELQNL